jgi:hypothetical protein
MGSPYCAYLCLSIHTSKLDQLTDFLEVIGCHLIATFFVKFSATCDKDVADEPTREVGATLALLRALCLWRYIF